MKLRERFLKEMNGSPGVADRKPMGSGDANRHGMPRLPPGQVETKKWPVLDLGERPSVTTANFALRVEGEVATPLELSFADLMAMEQIDDVSDFHCVTTWSKFDMPWRGVRLADVIAAAGPKDDARYVILHASDGYDTNIPMAEALKEDVLLAHTVDGEPLAAEHGGPVRVVTPQLYAWKAAKWVCRIVLSAQDQPGFWELRGYSNSAHPWRDDRYS